MPSESGTNLRDALKVLGRSDPAWLSTVDGQLGNVLTGTRSHKSMRALYSWLLPRSTVSQRVHAALAAAVSRLQTTTGLERRELVFAIHTATLALALFDKVREALADAPALVVPEARDWHQEDHSFVLYLYTDSLPAPSTIRSITDNSVYVTRWASDRSERIHRTLYRYRHAGVELLEPDLASKITARYQARYFALTADVPEFAVWTVTADGTQARSALDRLNTVFRHTRGSTATAPLVAANKAALDEPLDGATGLLSIGQMYVSPRFRMTEAGPTTRLTDDEWWSTGVEPRYDATALVSTYLLSPAATRLPMLVIGAVGSGKSTLAKTLAASEFPGGADLVRVPLGSVDAHATVAEQVDQAVRGLTSGAVTWDRLDADLRVVVLDGLDELLQAHPDIDYLAEVAGFQQRQAFLDRPVAVVVTTRTSSLDQLRIPDGTPVVRLEAFDDDQIRDWIERWNQANVQRALLPETLLHHRELSRQPLLLPTLATLLNDPQTPIGLPTEELRRLLLDDVADRAGRDVAGFMVAALGAFNRGRAWLSEPEFQADLTALGYEVEPLPDAGMFPEYSIAWFVQALLVGMSGNSEPNDDLLFAVLSHQLLVTRPSILTFVADKLGTAELLALTHTVDEMVRSCRKPRGTTRFAAYRPTSRSAEQAVAFYSANLVLLRLSLGLETDSCSTGPQLPAVWHSQLDHDNLRLLKSVLDIGDGTVTRRSAPQQVTSDSPHAGIEFVHQGLFAGAKPVGELAWSAGGRLLTAESHDQRALWEFTADSAQPRRPLEALSTLAWHPSRPLAAFLQDRRLMYGLQVDRYETHRVVIAGLDDSESRRLGKASQDTRISWAPDGETLALADTHGVRIVDAITGETMRVRTFDTEPTAYASTPWWTPDGQHLLILRSSTVTTYRTEDLVPVSSAGFDIPSWDFFFFPDEARTIAAREGLTGIQIDDLTSGKPIAVLEGHTGHVTCVTFSAEGDFLATMSDDNTVRIWRRHDWECVATISRTLITSVGGLAFHPTEPLLAMKDGNHVDIVRLDVELLNSIASTRTARRYTNAKVVLVGDTGVGKSGLGLVLSGQPFVPTESTHSRNVWTFEKSHVATTSGDMQTRETLLWDLAGQPGYRMVHQLHLNEVAVALVVFDARSETDPFAGVQYWRRALAQARRFDEAAAARRLRIYLVAARADRGTAAVSRERIQATVETLGFDGYIETSAKEGWGVDDLIRTVRDGIDWDALPVVSSNELFEAIKDFVLEEKRQGGILSTMDSLTRSFRRTQGNAPDDLKERFAVCLGRLESVGVVRRMAYGDFVLLRPELLDSYASSLVEAAKNEPDGLGFVKEDDALEGRFRIPESERLTDPHQERVLLNAVVQELLRREIALKEITDREVDLIFPSQFTRQRPDAPNLPGQDVVFTFDGHLYSIYSTLAVRLSHSRFFQRGPMWHNSASYEASAGGTCGIAIREIEDGKGELALFYDEPALQIVRSQFEAYVVEHLHQRAVAVEMRRVRSCKPCRYVVEEHIIRRRLDRGVTTMTCPGCDETVISLVDQPEHRDLRPAVAAMNSNADAQRDQDVAAVKLKGKRDEGAYDVFLCHNVKDKHQVVRIARKLEEQGILPWLDVDAIQPGTQWQPKMAQGIEQCRSAAVLLGPHGPGQWHDMEMQLINELAVRNGKRVIPVILDGTDGDLELPGFVKVWSTVDMRLTDPDPVEQLIWGVTGEHPRRI